MRDKLIDFNMAALSGEYKRMDIWRLITPVPVLITCLIHALICSERQVCESNLCNAPFLCLPFLISIVLYFSIPFNIYMRSHNPQQYSSELT